MKGFVPTPEPVVDLMVEKLFHERPPSARSRVLDPGCGRGAFVEGIIRWCSKHELPVPSILGIESNPAHVAYLREYFADVPRVAIQEADFLLSSHGSVDYVIGNPPYVAITALSDVERAQYRRTYRTARGRFDLYLLFFEQALRLLKPRGRLVFITPEKYLYVETAAPLRRLLSERGVDELHFLDEETFAGLVTYPLVTTVGGAASPTATRVIDRTGIARRIRPLEGHTSWMPSVRGASIPSGAVRLEDVAIRISCGVATGADSVFVVRDSALAPRLRAFAHPTIAGRDITCTSLPVLDRSLLIPYDRDGHLLPETKLGKFGDYLSDAERKARLLGRTCVASKPWYAFHENPPLRDILRPKILCKDIGATPLFVVDHEGTIVPRHSVYYIVPANPERIDELAEYLNSEAAASWLRDHCQRAASGFLRLQSHVLKKLPLPTSLESLAPQLDLVPAGPHRRSA
ncbi:MAG TPA: TaqI-like C-terminal specificity domain-containing protein [Gemmatimonadaceae bacterium]|nr:TaqI-like C-terminal specificity domain-containing protein [Gemmatimonadaceae bacterium]